MQGQGKDGEPLNAEQLSKLLQSLMEGVQLTQRVLDQVRSQPVSQRALACTVLAYMCLSRSSTQHHGISLCDPCRRQLDVMLS